MTAAEQTEDMNSACSNCLRRSWLLATLGACLDYSCRQPDRLMGLLALDDEDLLKALGGRRRADLERRYARFNPSDLAPTQGVESVCRHARGFPHALLGGVAPHMLNVAGGVGRLEELAALPVVAIVGSSWATDYGMEMARSLARGLAASGVTVASGLVDGIAAAAQAGALAGRGSAIAVLGGGLDVACPARRHSLYERIRQAGCAVAELPCGWPARRSGRAAGERIIVGLAELTVVVEADDSPSELAAARMAQALGRTVAAVPGRVTSPASRGTHALLIDQALSDRVRLVRGPGDVLELLHGMGIASTAAGVALAGLEPRLKTTLERVGAGSDTPNKLERDGRDAREVLLALSELELLGLLVRGDGGRYVPRDALPS
jgi:DNA processing protein